jgi:hypothetical protein
MQNMYFSGKELERMLYILGVFAGTWKYVSVKIVQSYSVFHALSNGVVFIVSARSQKFDPVDMNRQNQLENPITLAQNY